MKHGAHMPRRWRVTAGLATLLAAATLAVAVNSPASANAPKDQVGITQTAHDAVNATPTVDKTVTDAVETAVDASKAASPDATMQVAVQAAVAALNKEYAIVNHPPLKTATTRWKCGSPCNGLPPTSGVPGNGVVCYNTRVNVWSGHPKTLDAPIITDTGETLYIQYSPNCQTLWGYYITTAAQARRVACNTEAARTLAPTYVTRYNGACPSVGHHVLTRMIDDSDPNLRIAGFVQLDDYWSGGPYGTNFYAWSSY